MLRGFPSTPKKYFSRMILPNILRKLLRNTIQIIFWNKHSLPLYLLLLSICIASGISSLFISIVLPKRTPNSSFLLCATVNCFVLYYAPSSARLYPIHFVTFNCPLKYAMVVRSWLESRAMQMLKVEVEVRDWPQSQVCLPLPLMRPALACSYYLLFPITTNKMRKETKSKQQKA